MKKKRIISCILIIVMTVFVWKTAEQAKNYRQNKPIEAVSEIITIWEKPQEPMLTIPILAAQVESDEPELNKAQLDEIDLDSAQSVQLQSEEESEYANLAIADVSNYVNVRSEPSTEGEIVGKIYNGAVAQILGIAGEEEDWLRIISGSVEGYIKAEYFIYGEAAAEVVEEYITRYACVLADRLNVRKEPSIEAKRIGYMDRNEKLKVLEDCGDWLRVQYTDSKEGYIAAEYAEIVEEFVYARSMEEERAELAAQQALAARIAETEQSTPENTKIVFPETSYTSNEELRKSIVDYAMQFLGNAYVHGGRSLSEGTDCSGFTCYIYADFGYSISRTPQGQYTGAGRSISYEEIQPGDIICYSSNGKKCTHVGLYIGDGQIVHAANSKKGVVINAADYSTIIGIRNVID
ncbi:MAG: SH3 domain-containing protein [Acetatifactor sp.]